MRQDSMGPTGWMVVLLLLAAALAGCVSDDDVNSSGDGSGENDGDNDQEEGDQDDRNETGLPTMPGNLTFDGCSLQGGQFRVPMMFFEGYNPGGMQPVSADPAGATTIIEVVAVACDSATFGNETRENILEFRTFLDVVPSSEHANPDAARHAVSLDTVVADPDLLALYHGWNLIASAGSISVSSTEAAAARTGQASAAGEWESLELQTTVASGAPQCQQAFTMRTFGLADWETVSNYVDIHLEDTCLGLGHGDLKFEQFGDDPEALLQWLLVDGVTNGLGYHTLGGDLSVEQVYVPLE